MIYRAGWVWKDGSNRLVNYFFACSRDTLETITGMTLSDSNFDAMMKVWTPVPVVMVEIPKPDKDGGCSNSCPFNYDCGYRCEIDFSGPREKQSPYQKPGPKCPAKSDKPEIVTEKSLKAK